MDKSQTLDSALLDHLFNNPYSPIALLDIEFNFIRVNSAYAAADQKTPINFVGKNHFELFPNDENKLIFEKVRDTGKPYHAFAKPFEYEANPERGVSHWDWTLTPVFDDSKAVSGLLLVLIDVTEHVNALISAERERKFSKSIMDLAGELVIVLDAQGKINFFNKACEQLTGYSREEVCGKFVWDFLLKSEECEAVKKTFENISKTQKPSHFENYWVGKDGSSYLVRWSNTTIVNELSRNVDYVISVGSDITDQKEQEQILANYRTLLERRVNERTEELVKAKEEAESANAQKSVFLGRMSHELRTPMNAVLGFGQLLEEKELDEDTKSCVDEIMKASRHLYELISDLLDLSQIESGNIKIEYKETQIFDFIESCISIVSNLAQKKNVSIIQSTEKNMPHSAFIDEKRLKEVLVNILTNSIKYSSDDSHVMLSLKYLNSGCIRVEVCDSGYGISDDDISYIFEPFRRSSYHSNHIEGVGIGLSVAKQLIELMGGTIGVRSQLGKGSLFWFEIPVRKQLEMMIEKENNLPIKNIKSTGRILYVEDNPANLRLIQQILKPYSQYELAVASSGNQGLELLKSEVFDLVLLDINLPDIDGFSILETIRSSPRSKDTTVVAISAAAREQDINNGLSAGFKRYLTKPIDINEFIELVKEELSHK
ncbi:PAS domain-containing hybrid sensor histidine kinase/response regulator [Pleionea sediminis]|uniref:PAS domain-containing hybrid sensor histidine kinase/response regulator n=1 Tax=Pleionea sediminis TaxID=2569479 RepID=UPI00118495EB|nr:PAS domain-containing hybrid sensor histidine kinase/response regulator [Pleionea sediminis]